MELDALKFTVDTDALDDAITKVGTLQLAVKKLGSETTTPKVIKADNIVSKDAEERVTKLNNVLERQQDILAFMASGFSKGQASVLAFGKTAGLATDQLKQLGDVLDTQRKLIGGDTFDKSNSALKALQNQYALLKDAARAYNDESSLTQKQLQGLGLDKERLLEKYKIEGKSLSDIKSALRDLNSEYNKAAISVNQQVAANTKLAESSRKTASGQELANKALAKADEMLAKLQNRVQQMSTESPVSATAANQLYAYEKALKAAGVGADEATARLSVFRAEQQKVSQLSRAEETLRMQHLSRALAPQVTDVTVGLMTGQNPFTVFLQQGGQIRDQIGLSQVAVENLGKVFKDTFVMMGAMVVAMGRALYAFFLTPVGAAVLALSAFAVTIYKIGEGMLEAETRTLEINKALILFGNTAGLTVESLKGLSKEASSMDGISLNKSTEAMIAFSKAGEMTSDEFVKAAQSAVMFEKYAGVAISDTAKVYKELSKDPLKAVSKLNEETGFFTATIIKQIAEYERLGDKEAAAALSRKTYTDATMQAALDIKDSLSGLGLFMDSVGNIATEMWKKIKGLSVQAPLKEQRDALIQELSILGQAESASKGTGKRTNVLMVDPAIKQKMQELELLQDKIDKADNRAAEQQRNTSAGKDMSEYQSMINANKLKTESKQQKIDRINIISAGDIAIAAGKGAEEAKTAIEMRDKLIRDIETGKGGPKKAKEEKTDAFSINLSNELQQYEKQYGIEIKLQDDFIRQEKARLDNALAAKEITQGEFNARDLAASERGYTDRQALSDKYYSGIIQANEKNISEMVQQYQEWVNQEGGTPKFFEQNEKAVETLRSKIINTNNETSVFLEKIQASAASAKETAFTRYSKQLSTLQGEIRGVTLAYDEYLQSEANLTKQKQAQVALEDKVRFATPEQALAIKAAADETERLTKYVQDYDKQIRDSKMSLEDAVNVYLDELSLTGKVSENAQKQLDLLKDKYDLLVKTKGLIESTVESKATEAADAATLKYQKDQMKALSDSVAGAIETGLFEGGDAGSKALRKIIEAELRKPITIFIKAVVGDIFGGVTGETTGASGGMAGGSGLLSTLSSAYDALVGKLSFSGSNSYINAANSSLGGSLGLSNTFGTSATAGQMAYTEALMSGATAAEANAAALTASQANLTTFGKGVGIAGDALAGYGLQKAISGDKTIAGGKVVDALTIAGSAVFGPVAGIIGGLVNRAFGKGDLEMTGAGTRGTFGTSGFQGQNYQNYKRGGGWFSSDENTTDISAVPASSVKAWSTAFTSVKKSMKDATESIGLSAESFKDYAKYVDVAAGTTAEGLAALFTGMADEMVQGLLGTTETIVSTIGTIPDFFSKEFAKQFNKEVTTKIWHPSDLVKEGETASETILRLSSSLKEVNTWFGFLGSTLLKVSLVSADTASKLADVFGGLDKFSAAASAYYVDFYSEQERASKSSLDMAKALALVGLELPKTKEAFRELVTEVSKNLETAPMREAYALLLKIAPEFSSVVDVFAKANKEMFELLKTTAADSLSTLTKAVSKEKEKLQTVYDTTLKKLNTELSVVNDSVSKLSSLASSLKSTLDNLRITGSEGDYRKQAQSQISQALAKARTGTLPLNGELTSALSTVSKPSEALFGSFVDYARDFYKTVNDITELSDITGKKLTADELTQSLLNKQIETLTLGFEAENARLDGILEKAQEQLDAANGVNNSILSVKEAIEGLTTALNGMAGAIISSLKSGTIGSQEAIAKLTGTTGGSLSSNQWSAVKTATGSTDVWASSGGAAALKDASGSQTIYAKSGEVFTAQQAIDSVNKNLAKGNAAQVYADAKRTGISAASLDALMGWSAGTSNAWAAANKLPSFAIGTNFVPNDMVANIHKGERIIPAADNTLLMQKLSSTDNTALLQEIKSLKEEVINLRYEQRADVDQNSKISKVLTRVSKNGESLQVITGAVYNIPA